MYKTLKAINRIKLDIRAIKGSWTYNHKHLILTLSLITVIIVQNYGVELIKLIPVYEIVAVNEQKIAECDYKCLTSAWVDLRTEEIIKENMEDYRTESRYQALMEANKMITEI